MNSFTSKDILFFLWIFSFSFCSSENSDIGKTDFTESPHRQATPDTTTFFPLVEGSYWIYSAFFEGEIQNKDERMDSVISIIYDKDTCRVKMLSRRNDVDVETFFYIIDKDGFVSEQKIHYKSIEPFCRLRPRPGNSVGTWVYSKFLYGQKSSIRLETSDYENASYEEQLEWQGKIFEKGIGMVSYGGSESSMNLSKFRIGMGEARQYEE